MNKDNNIPPAEKINKIQIARNTILEAAAYIKNLAPSRPWTVAAVLAAVGAVAVIPLEHRIYPPQATHTVLPVVYVSHTKDAKGRVSGSISEIPPSDDIPFNTSFDASGLTEAGGVVEVGNSY